MKAKEIYKKETGLEPILTTKEYMSWLEEMVEQRYEPSILK